MPITPIRMSAQQVKIFYMTASSFGCAPGLPILHSKDLVNWKYAGYALKQIEPIKFFNAPQHGKGVWAPSIRHHNREFYIYWEIRIMASSW